MNEENTIGYTEKDVLLTQFQDLIGAYDVEECLALLESSNWNIDDAVQLYFNQHQQSTTATTASSSSSNVTVDGVGIGVSSQGPLPPQMMQFIRHHIETTTSSGGSSQLGPIIGSSIGFSVARTSVANSGGAMTSTTAKKKEMDDDGGGNDDEDDAGDHSDDHHFGGYNNNDLFSDRNRDEHTRYLEFEIEYKQHDKYCIKLSDSDTIKSIKKLCKQKFNIEIDDQSLRGWKVDRIKRTKLDNDVKLRDLNLAYKTTLYLINNKEKQQSESAPAADEVASGNAVVAMTTAAATALLSSPTTTTQINERDSGCSKSKEHELVSSCNNKQPITYELCINYDNNADFKPIKLNYESNKTLADLKQSLFKLTSIKPSDQQLYYCENENESDKKTVAVAATASNNDDGSVKIFVNDKLTNQHYLYDLCALINKNRNTKLNFYLRRRELVAEEESGGDGESVKPSTSKKSNENKMDVDDEDEYYDVDQDDDDDEDNNNNDDDDDDLIDIIDVENDSKSHSSTLSLMTNEYKSEIEALEYFNRQYTIRYGPLIPQFCISTLLDACNNSIFINKLADRKQLLIYVHVDKQLYSNLFNTNLLCNDEICNYLENTNNYTIWPWDITEYQNELYFYSRLDELKLLTNYSFNDLDRIKVKISDSKAKLPCLIVLERIKLNIDLVKVIDYEETQTKERLIFELIELNDSYENRKQAELNIEMERERRERLKREQDMEFQRSLIEDKAKKEQKQREEQEKKQKEMDYKQKILDCFNQLPKEPEFNDTNKATVATIRFKEPSEEPLSAKNTDNPGFNVVGGYLVRKFLISDPISTLFNYMGSLGYFCDEYKLLQTWPRRDLTQLDSEQTLEQLKLYPQETIIIERR